MGIEHRIRAGIKAFGLTGAKLAILAGLPNRQMVSRILNGDRPGLKHIGNLAQALECDVTWLTTGRGIPPAWWSPDDGGGDEEEGAPARAETPGRSEGADVELARLAREQQREIARLLAQVREVDSASRRLEADVARLEVERARIAAELALLKAQRRGRSKPPPGE